MAMSQFKIDDLLKSQNQDNDVTSAVDKLVTDKAFLFTPQKTGKNVNIGGSTGTSGKQLTKEEFNKLTYGERVELYNNDKELYNQMTEREE